MDRFSRFRHGAFITLLVIIVSCVSVYFALPHETLEADAARGSGTIVMDVKSKAVLKGDNTDVRLPMASTTKTMTALVVIENCKLEEIVTITKASVGIEGSSIYLKDGERLTVKELLFGLMLRSGNDSAVALAIHTAGSLEQFVEMMNLRAESMGLTNTHFCNPHGLHDDNHYTTCYDLAYITAVAMQDPDFKAIVSTKQTVIGQGESIRFLQNKNKILNLYPGGNGVKTGYTTTAGRCLVASAERNGVQLVSVVLNRGDMWNECMSLLDYGFQQYGL